MSNRASFLVLSVVAFYFWWIAPSAILLPRGLIGKTPHYQEKPAVPTSEVTISNEPQQPILGFFSVQIAERSPIEDPKGALMHYAKALVASIGAKHMTVGYFGKAGPSLLLQGTAS